MKAIPIIPLVAAILTVGCVHHDEVEFEGTVVGVRNCTSAMVDVNAGYVIQLTKPEGMGGELVSDNGERMTGLVVLYEPDEHIRVHDKVYGTCYWDDSYSRGNCTIRWDAELPEGVIVKVKVEK